MGHINRFNLRNYFDKGFDTFVETGTAKGDGIDFALINGFNKIYSVEYSEVLYNYCVDKYMGNTRVNLIHNISKKGLEQILSNKILNGIVFWLDAHYPFADLVGNEETFNKGDDNIRLPLEEELRVIKEMRPNNRDVIIIDDLRIYEDNNYQSGNIPEFINPPKTRNINFVYELFGDTHNISKDLRNEGYLILEPNE